MERTLLIAGIDPGTTTGYALLDSYGKIIAKRASKELEINSLIKEMTDYGIILAVGTDKKKCPALVEKFATKVGAKLIIPEDDLPVKEKNEMAKDFSARNSHEEDALASAIFAFKEVNPLLRKIRKYLKIVNKEEMINDAARIVFNEKINIKKAVEMLERKEEMGEIEEEAIEHLSNPEKLREKAINLRKENRIIRRYNMKLKNEIRKLVKYKKIAKSNELNIEQKIGRRLENKEKNIIYFTGEIAKKEKELRNIKDELEKIKSIMLNLGGKIIIKKLNNFGMNEVVGKIRKLDIRESDILLVEDANVYSEKALAMLNNVQVIVFKKPLSRKTRDELRFIFIDAKNLNLEEHDDFAVAGKDELEREKISQNLLMRVIDSYRKERREIAYR